LGGSPRRRNRTRCGSAWGVLVRVASKYGHDDKQDLDEHFEKVKEGLGPDEKTSYAPAQTGEDVKEKAENVRREIREDRRRARDS
jgi:hypothetical protein